MNYEIVTPDEVNQRFPPDGERPALRRAFDNRCLIQKDNHYLMHPGCLFELIKRNNLFP
jgi:hypothetical protein